MNLQKEDLPATIQAFDLQDDKEIFIAEQVVNSQYEVETFTNRFTGKLIKAKKVPIPESYADTTHPVYSKRRTSTGIIMFVIILIIVALVIYGFSTGWIQEKLHLNV